MEAINIDGYTALKFAIEENHLLIVRELLMKGIKAHGIEIAIKNNSYDIVYELILYGFKINNLNYLEIAYNSQNNQILNLLINNLENEQKKILLEEWIKNREDINKKTSNKKASKKSK